MRKGYSPREKGGSSFIPNGLKVQELTLRDGSVLYGRVTKLGDPFTFLLLSGAEMVVSPTQVRSLTGAEGQVVDGEFWREDPNQTRLFFGPSPPEEGHRLPGRV